MQFDTLIQQTFFDLSNSQLLLINNRHASIFY